MEQSLNKLFPLKPFKASTLHALLNIRESVKKREELLSADLIIVDESSMIDLHVLNRLLASVKPGARLILIGDPHQLAPVESGSLFSDLVAYARPLPNGPVELKTCLRTELRSLVQVANAIKTGYTHELLQLLESKQEGIAYRDLPEEGQKKLVEEAIPHFLPPDFSSPQQLLTHFNRFRLLSPFRKGPYGVESLNRLLAKACTHTPLPIILTRSDRRLGLFNGEMGVLLSDCALFPAENGEVRRLSPLLLPPYEYAFCLSVYKAQGSEFDEVWVVLPEGSEYFGREVLYTAVTRARRKIQIWGSHTVIANTCARRAVRTSRFK